jgi:hypothetical protein
VEHFTSAWDLSTAQCMLAVTIITIVVTSIHFSWARNETTKKGGYMFILTFNISTNEVVVSTSVLLFKT